MTIHAKEIHNYRSNNFLRCLFLVCYDPSLLLLPNFLPFFLLTYPHSPLSLYNSLSIIRLTEGTVLRHSREASDEVDALEAEEPVEGIVMRDGELHAVRILLFGSKVATLLQLVAVPWVCGGIGVLELELKG